MSTLAEALRDRRSSVRLRAVMDAGTAADPADLDLLVAQCAAEDDFFVRDMLTWALTRLPPSLVVSAVLPELDRPEPQARSQALHTLSKVGDPTTWEAVAAHIADPEDEVARPAWRAAVMLVPAEGRANVARGLAAQLGRGDRETRLSLSRAIVGLGADVASPLLDTAEQSRRAEVREHAARTRRLLDDPDSGSDLARERAQREVALGRTRDAKG